MLQADGSLRLDWQLEVFDSAPTVSLPRPLPPPASEALSADLGQLLTSGASADVEVVDGAGEVFPAHTLILSARSEVFARMLTHDMREAATKRIEIKDVSGDAIKCFLGFLYSGDTAAIGSIPGASWCDLLMLAKMYEVRSLVDICAHKVLQDLSPTNAAELFRVADALSLSELKQSVLDYIAGNPDVLKAVRDSDTFEHLSKDLMTELMDAALFKSTGKKRGREGDDPREFTDDTDWQQLSLAQLRRACKERGLAATGNKEQLRARLPGAA